LWLVCFLLALQVMMKGDLVILRLGFCPVTCHLPLINANHMRL